MRGDLLALVICSLISCQKHDDPAPDYCGEAIAEFKENIEYKGTIYFCNAQQPLMAFIPGEATIFFVDSSTFQFHLVADSINFDTTLSFKLDCKLAEKVIPSISFDGLTDNDIGYYSRGIEFITVHFGYPNCLMNTAFEGKSKY